MRESEEISQCRPGEQIDANLFFLHLPELCRYNSFAFHHSFHLVRLVVRWQSIMYVKEVVALHQSRAEVSGHPGNDIMMIDLTCSIGIAR